MLKPTGVTGAPGRKDDSEKLRYDLIPFRALDALVRVLTYGAKKYGPENWRKVENGRERYFAAAMRHLVAWRTGEEIDPESGESHLAHAACSIFFLLDAPGVNPPEKVERRPLCRCGNKDPRRWAEEASTGLIVCLVCQGLV